MIRSEKLKIIRHLDQNQEVSRIYVDGLAKLNDQPPRLSFRCIYKHKQASRYHDK